MRFWVRVVNLGLFIGLITTQPVAAQQTDQERELEKLVRQLIDKVERLERRVVELEGGEIARPTQQRIEKLEQSVEEIQASSPPPAQAKEWQQMRKWMNNPLTLRPFWKDALNFESNDGSVKLKIGGRIQNDWAFFAEDSDIERRLGVNFGDGTEFRRARIYISGQFGNDTEFKAQYDFAGGDADFKDVFLGFKNVDQVGNIRVGQFKEPFSIEQQTSSNYLTFMERSLVNTFVPSRNVGVMFYDSSEDQRMTWAVGVFRQTDSFGDGVGGRDYNVTGRVTFLPIYEDDGKKLLHLGLSYTHQNYENDRMRFRARPESHLSPRLVDTGVFLAERGDFVGVEVAWVDGPFSIQGEYVHAFIDGPSRFFGDPEFYAASLQASYFLTGEHRPYRKSSGAFTRVRPLENYSKQGGTGAWELAARYSYLTLNDHNIRGGRLKDLTLGVNWYWNPNFRMMWNYVLANPNKGSDVSIFQWRIQLAF